MRWGPCAGVNAMPLVCCSHLVCSKEAQDYLKGIPRQHQLQHFHTLLFLSLFLVLPFCLVLPVFHLAVPFQINSLSLITFSLSVPVLLCPYSNLVFLIPLPSSPWSYMVLMTRLGAAVLQASTPLRVPSVTPLRFGNQSHTSP